MSEQTPPLIETDEEADLWIRIAVAVARADTAKEPIVPVKWANVALSHFKEQRRHKPGEGPFR